MNKTDLDAIIAEAKKFGLHEHEIDRVRREYYTAITTFDDRVKAKPGVESFIKHEEMRHWTAYAAAMGYVRRTIDQLQRNDDATGAR